MSKLTDSSPVPQHVAIIMDGNGRWAKKRLMPRVAGHRQGLESLNRCVAACLERSVKALTVFAFSSENWLRPEEEVSALMELLVKAIDKEVGRLSSMGVQIHFVGDQTGLSEPILQAMGNAHRQTAGNNTLTLNVCFNYGGRWDMTQAAAQVAAKALPLTEAHIANHLALAHCADPDLLIRTGGEQRISNFLLWQCAYSELYFSDALWPDFDEAALDLAFLHYASRERRFGKTSEQVRS